MMKRCFICEKKIFDLWQEWDYDKLYYRTKFDIAVATHRYYHLKCLEKFKSGPPMHKL